MCGIAGFSWRDERLVKTMMDTLRHRGPDDEGFFVDDDVSLGHRRLSILDLSAAGPPADGSTSTMVVASS